MNELEKTTGFCISQSVNRSDLITCYRKLLKEGVIEKYEEYGLVPIIYGRLTAQKIDTHELFKKYNDLIERDTLRLKSLFDCARVIVLTLQKEGINVAYLKNSAIAKLTNLKLIENPMGDIDFLVKEKDLAVVKDIMAKMGTIVHDSQFADKNDEFEVVVSKDGFEHRYEFQTRPVSGRWISETQEPHSEMIWNSVRKIENDEGYILSPEILLLTVCLHTAKHSFVRSPGFRLHTDVDRLVVFDTIDWDRFIKLVYQLKVSTPVYIALLLSHEFLGTKIPGEVLSAIKISRYKEKIIIRSLRNVGFLNPNKKKWGRLSYIFFTTLLYDDFQTLLRHGIISRREAQRRYNLDNRKSIIYFNFKRFLDLLINRRNY